MTSRRKTKGKGRKERLSCRGVIGGVGASALGAMIKQGLYNARFAWGAGLLQCLEKERLLIIRLPNRLITDKYFRPGVDSLRYWGV